MPVHNSRKGEAEAAFRAACEKGLTPDELAVAMGTGRLAASRRCQRMQREGAVVMAPGRACGAGRYFIASMALAAAEYVYPFATRIRARTEEERRDDERDLMSRRAAELMALIKAAGADGLARASAMSKLDIGEDAIRRRVGLLGSAVEFGRDKDRRARFWAAGMRPAQSKRERPSLASPVQQPFSPSPTTSIREARRKLDSDQPTIVPPTARITRIPTVLDHRHTVRSLAPGHVSVLDPRECRGWAREVVR